MLNQIMPSFFSAEGKGEVGISSGGLAKDIKIASEQQTLKNLAVIPQRVSEKHVTEIAKTEANLEANVELMKLWSQRALSAQSQALAGIDVRINHAQQAMRNETTYRTKLSKHGKNVLINNIENRAIAENLNAYQVALNSASETVKI